MIEHIDLYPLQDRVPVGELDYIIPPGNAVIRRSGEDITVLSYLSMVHRSLEAIDESGVDAELIDLRWLDRASVDWDTIGSSIRKTNAVLIVEQGARGTSYGGWLSDELNAGSSTGSTNRSVGSPAAKQAQASPRCWSERR